MESGQGPGLHVHSREHELWYVLEGEFRFLLGDSLVHEPTGGLAFGLLLLDEELATRYGPDARLLVAPMRNLLLAAPFDADRSLVRWLHDEISHEDPNGLNLPTFALIDGHLSIDARAERQEEARVH